LKLSSFTDKCFNVANAFSVEERKKEIERREEEKKRRREE
jgi:hypothetical protein